MQFAVLAARKAASLDADVLFATSTPLTIAWPAVYAARRQAIPRVFEVRDLWPEVPLAIGSLRTPPTIAAARRLERFAYRHSARIVALSPSIKAGIANGGCSRPITPGAVVWRAPIRCTLPPGKRSRRFRAGTCPCC